jgi:hypothetical protein
LSSQEITVISTTKDEKRTISLVQFEEKTWSRGQFSRANFVVNYIDLNLRSYLV